ncbi:SusC/RagA family TonB-linked outer membrane protein [Flavobacteriales bacterium]|nr:SusC/RagA family TonB-linked outer membrane protein [Flavobacteriales bacterium]
MKKHFNLFSLFFLAASMIAFAQSSVTGTVSDAEGSPLPGATVVVQGTSSGVTTDFDGNYSINASSGDVLSFSYVGYQTVDITVGSSLTINVTLTSDSALDEVIVTAYGTQTKQSVVGSVASIGSEILESSKATSVTQALQGSVPGVNIITSGGIPGTNPTIRIRGIGSINASASPFIVVDGAPYAGNLNALSQDQIESISVLKDASATALYGSAAANGVIIITTKSGKLNSEAKISVNIKKGIASEAVDTHRLMGINQWSELYWEAKRNNFIENGLSTAAANAAATANFGSSLGYNAYGIANPVGTDGKLTASPLWDTDWKGALMDDQANFDEIGVSLSGGSKNTTYFFTTNYLSEDGNVTTTNFERYSSRIKVDSKVNDVISAGMNVGYTRSSQNTPTQSGSGYSSTVQWIYNVPNFYPIYRRNADGSYMTDTNGGRMYDYGANSGILVNGVRPVFEDENAYGSLFLYDIYNLRTDFNASLYATIDISDNLKFSSRFAYQSYMFSSFQYIHRDFGYASSVNGRVSQGRDLTQQTNAQQQLTYIESFDDHNIEADLIYVANNYNFDDFGASGEGYLPGVKILNGATTPSSVSGYTVDQRYTNILGRVKYNFDEKYYIEGSVSQGLSSKFAESVREGTFYSVGGSWILSNESFLADSDVVDFLKVKASYGEVGNDRGIGSFPYITLFNTGWNQLDTTGVLAGGLNDPYLTWEKTATSNFGTEFGLFGGKLDGSIEYYERESVDLIYDKPVPPSTGNSSVRTNVGSLKNYGIEVVLSSQIVKTDDLSINAAVNFSTENNEITELTQEEFISGTKKWMVGRSLYDFFIYEWAGVDSADGYGMFYKDILDADGEPTGEREITKEYSEATRYYQDQTSIPDILGGFNAQIQYKDFDFSVLVNFALGGYVYDSSYASLMAGYKNIRQQSPDLANRWQQPGDVTDVPILLENNNDFNALSTRFLFENDYLRVKGLTLGYTINNSPALSSVGIDNVRVYAQATNPFTFHKHFGIDPEQNLGGSTSSRSYQLKTFTVGLNIEL